jgi:formylglycine-generating enzyme
LIAWCEPMKKYIFPLQLNFSAREDSAKIKFDGRARGKNFFIKPIAKIIAIIALVGLWFGTGVSAADLPKQLNLDLGNNAKMNLVLIPAGKFIMGSPETEAGRWPDEVQHEVTISKPFYMGVTHVTVDQFAAFVKDSGYKTDAERDGWSIATVFHEGKLGYEKVDGRSWRNPSFPQTGDHPVVQVSWNDAKAFCDWLSKKSGRSVNLPTEAQWEYAARAGAKTAFPWGDNPDDGKGWANFDDLSFKNFLKTPPKDWIFANYDDGYVFTSPVGIFKPNAFGLYDVVGNVWQWCSDYYGPVDENAVTDPTGPATGEMRIARGGCWFLYPKRCRLAHRHYNLPDLRRDNYGFRVMVATDGDDSN